MYALTPRRASRRLTGRTAVATTALVLVVACTTSCSETPRVCGTDGSCPPHTVCLEGICKNVPWWTDIASLDADATGAADVVGCPNAPPADQTSVRASSAGGWVDGALEVFGGDPKAGGRCQPHGTATALARRWRPCAGWQAHSGSVPGPRASAASTQGLDSVWMFAGRKRTQPGGPWVLLGDLWRLSGSPARWTLAAATHAPLRHHSTLAVQQDPPSLWVHGGDAGTLDSTPVLLPDIRRYRMDQGVWQVPPVSGKTPAARAEHCLVAIDGGKSLLLFGGRGAAGLLGDTWRFDTQAFTWSQASGPAPSARRGAAMVVAQGSVWLFGGIDASDQRFRNDLWRRPAKPGGTWTRVRAGDLGAQATVGGVATAMEDPCTPPSNFVVLDQQSPPRRAHALLSVGEGALWLHGGRGECGALGDVWRFDLATQSWQLVGADTRGWSCARSGATCANWCGT